MTTNILRNGFIGMLLIAGLGLGGCVTVVTEAAQKAWEDRSTDDQVIDTKIAAGILERLANRDKGLVIDISTDVWEQRALLTGTLDSAKERSAVVRLVREDKRIKKLYRHIVIVSEAKKEERRADAGEKDSGKKGGVGQSVSDFWIETKIKLALVTADRVSSVNYRWRSVLNRLFVIGRAGSVTERNKVLEIIRQIEGVKSVRHYIEIKPLGPKAGRNTGGGGY